MPQEELTVIEAMIDHLSNSEQLKLIEELARRLRSSSSVLDRVSVADQLAAMAGDSQVRDELKRIEQEFAPTETDGLGRN